VTNAGNDAKTFCIAYARTVYMYVGIYIGLSQSRIDSSSVS